jgi:hypothetical protein
MRKKEGPGSESGSGSISQRHGSVNLDPDPDPHQNVMDPQHWRKQNSCHALIYCTRNCAIHIVQCNTFNFMLKFSLFRLWLNIHSTLGFSVVNSSLLYSMIVIPLCMFYHMLYAIAIYSVIEERDISKWLIWTFTFWESIYIS